MVIDPTCQWCSCGHVWKPRLYHKLLMLCFGGYSRRCSQCGTLMRFQLMHHVVKVSSKSIKNRGEVWKNG